MDETEAEHGGQAFDVSAAAAAAAASREQQTPHFWLHFRGLKDTGSGGDCRARRAGRPGKTLRFSVLIHIIVRHKLAWTAEARWSLVRLQARPPLSSVKCRPPRRRCGTWT